MKCGFLEVRGPGRPKYLCRFLLKKKKISLPQTVLYWTVTLALFKLFIIPWAKEKGTKSHIQFVIKSCNVQVSNMVLNMMEEKREH